MTTDPPPAEFEDVRIDNFQSRLPSDICTRKEIFDEVFSLETWKTVLNSAQRDRILKMLPPAVLKVPGAAEKTIEDLFSKNLKNFDSNPLDTFFDKLANGHYDPEVVKTKSSIVREWRRDSLRRRRSYHTKLLQDLVISREKHLRKLAPSPAALKRNGKKGTGCINDPNVNSASSKKNGKLDLTNNNHSSANINGKSDGKGDVKVPTGKSKTSGSANGTSRNQNKTNTGDQGNKTKRGRSDVSVLSPTNQVKEGPAKKKPKQSSATKSKGSNTNKKAKDIVVVTTSQPSSATPATNFLNSSLLSGTNSGGQSSSLSQISNSSLLLGTLTGGSSHFDPPTLSLCSSSSATPTSLLESLTSPINPLPPPAVLSNSSSETITSGVLGKQYPRIFPSPILSSSSVSSTQSPSYLPSPVQSSPILASQLQAPSPISVNLSSITGGSLTSSRNGNITSSPSHSSITLNYTQAPLPMAPSATVTSQQTNAGLLDEESSSDEFEFEAIEPTIGFGGPSTAKSSANLKSPSAVASGSSFKKGTGTISSQELANIQKCSLLTNCLTQPLPPNSSASVSAALANNILTSTPVPTPIVAQGGTQPAVYQILQQGQNQQPKIIVTSGGVMANSSAASQQQLQRFLSIPSSSPPTQTQKGIAQQHQLGLFQPQQKNIAPSSSSSQAAVDAQTLVNSIMASSKDLLATFGASISPAGGGTSASTSALNQKQQHSTNVLPIAVNLQNVLPSGASDQQHQTQLKPTTFIRETAVGSTSALLSRSQTLTGAAQTQQLLALPSQSQSIVVGQGSSLNTQSLQLPSSILSNNGSVGKISSSPLASSSIASASIPNLLDSDDLNLNLGSFSLGGLGGMNLDMGVTLPDIDASCIGSTVGSVVDNMKLEIDCGMDKMDDLSGVLDGNPFDSIPNLSDELDGLDLDMVDGLCDFEGLLSEEKQYASFFSLIRDVLCSTRDHRMTLVCLEKTIRKWSVSAGAALNPWYIRVQDWNNALIVALNFLAGNYQDVHPEDFVPYIEYKYKTKYYQWIGAGRDGDNNLTPLCNLWMDNLDRLPPLKKNDGDGEEPEEEEDENEDSDTGTGGDPADAKKKNKRPQTPPPPRCTTDWTVRPSTIDEKEEFRAQEKSRFDNPHKAFTYRMHGYESVVGPVKGVYSSQSGITNKARGHSLLVDDRPPYVTILALVRDAVARLPNGEGTRSEICEMLRDSAFLAPEASNVTLNSVVSGALDRLHYERDPCVRYDSHKKSWIYLHRDRTQEQFERLHHNRSYTKSTKSRNSSSRKNRKGKSSSTANPTTSMSLSQSSCSSQSSTCAIEASLQSSSAGQTTTSTTVTTVLGVGSGAGGVVSTASGGTLVTLPPLSGMIPKVHNQQLNTLNVTTGEGPQQGKPQTIGVVSISNPAIQMQTQKSTSTTMQQSLSSVTGGQRLLTLPATSIQDGSQSLGQASLSDVLAGTGLRLQASPSNTTASVLVNQLSQQQGKQQATIIQDPNGGTPTRLVLQQPGSQASLHQAALQQQGSTQQSGIAPGQILLGSSAGTVLKLAAGNIRLGDGVRLAQLRLPSGNTAGTPGNPLAGSPLRLPQHRILLARGSLPGQPGHTQGVLLGQTATGQTVILSAGPPGGGTLAGLQQALSGSGATAGQIAVHHASSPVQLETSLLGQTSNPQQQQQQSAGSSQQSLQFTTSQTSPTTKFGIITSNVSPNGNSIMVSSGNSNSSTFQGSFSTSPRMQVAPVGNTSTLPSTSIALPASILAPSSSANFTTQSHVGHLSQQQQQGQPQQIILSSSNVQQQQQQQQTQGQTSQQVGTPVQLQGITQNMSQQHQNLLLSQSNTSQQTQGAGLQSQMHQQLTAPIIIRSAQGEFVSFGIPSHLSLGRGLQGIKVIPFPAGKQTVFARIVQPGANTTSAAGGTSGGTVVSVGGSNTITCNTANVNSNLNSSGSVTVANVPLGPSGPLPLHTVNATAVVGPAQSAVTTCSTNSNSSTNGSGGILSRAVVTSSSPVVVNNQSSSSSSS